MITGAPDITQIAACGPSLLARKRRTQRSGAVSATLPCTQRCARAVVVALAVESRSARATACSRISATSKCETTPAASQTDAADSDSLEDLACLQAARADVLAPRSTANVDAYLLKVGVEAALGRNHRMAAAVAERRSLPARVANLGHPPKAIGRASAPSPRVRGDRAAGFNPARGHAAGFNPARVRPAASCDQTFALVRTARSGSPWVGR